MLGFGEDVDIYMPPTSRASILCSYGMLGFGEDVDIYMPPYVQSIYPL
jgi:hypothetical protein